MPNGKKRLHKKYRFRRTFLVGLLGAIILISGIAIGSFIGNSSVTPKTDDTNIGLSNTEAKALTVPALDSSIQSDTTVNVDESTVNKELDTVDQPSAEAAKDDWALVVINHANPITEDFKVELEQVSGQYQLDARITGSFKQMIAAAKADGINLKLYSAYRTPEEQEVLFQEELNKLIDGGIDAETAYERVEKVIEPTWHSEHHTGLAVDICSPDTGLSSSFAGTASYKWLEENARRYGFILRYPKGKEQETGRDYLPYHFRYVGVEVANIIWKNEYSLEGYLYAKQLENSVATTGSALDVATDGGEEDSDGTDIESDLTEDVVAS